LIVRDKIKEKWKQTNKQTNNATVKMKVFVFAVKEKWRQRLFFLFLNNFIDSLIQLQNFFSNVERATTSSMLKW